LGFSALQRAENSSMNSAVCCRRHLLGFSALQRAENSSIERRPRRSGDAVSVSVLFSEPKIPQSVAAATYASAECGVSVLFSEPKIPQFKTSACPAGTLRTFQCSSASRKFLNRPSDAETSALSVRFSALQRAENSSMWTSILPSTFRYTVSVLFSEPKIPQ